MYMVSNAELRARARYVLEGSLFGNAWLMALLCCAAPTIVLSACTVLLPGLSFGLSVVLSGPLFYGVAYIFLHRSRYGGAINLTDLLRGFQDDFGGTLVLHVLMTVFVALWSMLFVIPGIVKAYGWSQVYNLKVDHPDWDWRTCMNESQRIMKGYKWQLFALDFSFIGWYIVGALCAGVGTLWVIPYHEAARTEFYRALLG